jgi:hypothetical protein
MIKYYIWPGVVVTYCNPSTQEVEAGESGVHNQSGLHSETLSLIIIMVMILIIKICMDSKVHGMDFGDLL